MALKIKISLRINRIYIQRRPIQAIKTFKVYITKIIKQPYNDEFT